MAVRKNDVLNVGRIQAEVLQPVDDFLLDGVVEQGLDDDDALTADERPGVVRLRAEEVEVVGNFGRLRVPGFARGRGARTAASGRTAAAWRRNAKPQKRSGPIHSGGDFRLADVIIDGFGGRLRGSDPSCCQKQRAQYCCDELHFLIRLCPPAPSLTTTRFRPQSDSSL